MCPIDPELMSRGNIGHWVPKELPNNERMEPAPVPDLEPHSVELVDPEDTVIPYTHMSVADIISAIDALENKLHGKWRSGSDLYERGLKRLDLLDEYLREALGGKHGDQ